MALPSVLTDKVGPLAGWQWVALGAGGIVAFGLLSRSRRPAGPVVLTPQASGTPTVSGNEETIGGLLPGLSDFLCLLPNAPNTFQIQLPNGSIINFENGVPTFGNDPAQPFDPDGQTMIGTTGRPCRRPAPDAPEPEEPNPNGPYTPVPYQQPIDFGVPGIPPIALPQPGPGYQFFIGPARPGHPNYREPNYLEGPTGGAANLPVSVGGGGGGYPIVTPADKPILDGVATYLS